MQKFTFTKSIAIEAKCLEEAQEMLIDEVAMLEAPDFALFATEQEPLQKQMIYHFKEEVSYNIVATSEEEARMRFESFMLEKAREIAKKANYFY